MCTRSENGGVAEQLHQLLDALTWNVESDRAGIIRHIQPGAGLQYHRLMKHVQDFWSDWPLEKRVDPVLKIEIVTQDGGITNGK